MFLVLFVRLLLVLVVVKVFTLSEVKAKKVLTVVKKVKFLNGGIKLCTRTRNGVFHFAISHGVSIFGHRRGLSTTLTEPIFSEGFKKVVSKG